MATFPLDRFHGYTSKTFTFKTTPEVSIAVDVVYPKDADGSPSTVLIHYHGGFLIVGDRYSFLPYWLVHASVKRNWIFVSPEYRLVPETTAHAAVEDAADAYKWVLESLPGLLGRSIGPVLVSGSSAGGYLALTTSAIAARKPAAVLLVYGMLDPADARYITPGPNVFGRPSIDPAPVLKAYPRTAVNDTRKPITAYPLAGDPAADARFSLVSALHIGGLFPDYLTGQEGLANAISQQGVSAVAEKDKVLLPLSFADLSSFPRTMLLHGKNDSAVPISCSTTAAEKLKAAGVNVTTEFPEDAEHGFDARAGNVNVEAGEADAILGVDSLKKVIKFLDVSN